MKQVITLLKKAILYLAIENVYKKQLLWNPPESNSNEIKTMIYLVEKCLYKDTDWRYPTPNLLQDNIFKNGKRIFYLIYSHKATQDI